MCIIYIYIYPFIPPSTMAGSPGLAGKPSFALALAFGPLTRARFQIEGIQGNMNKGHLEVLMVYGFPLLSRIKLSGGTQVLRFLFYDSWSKHLG